MKHWLQMALSVATLALISVPASATTITVSTTAVDTIVNGNCTIREAVEAANTNTAVDNCPAGQASGTDEIFINLFGTITLSGGSELIVTEQLSVRGLGRGATRLNGNNQRRLFRIVMTDMSDEFSLSDLRIENGRSSSADPLLAGGGVQFAQGRQFNVANVDFANNAALIGGGGAIYAGPLIGNPNARLSIENTRFLDNFATSSGGAIRSSVDSSGFEALRSLSIVGSEFRGNQSSTGFSAIMASDVETITLRTSQFSDNVSDDDDPSVSISSLGAPMPIVIVSETGFYNNVGGALQLFDSNSIITNVSFFENDRLASGTFGGAILINGGSTDLRYATLIDNADPTGSQILCQSCNLTLQSSIVWSESGQADDCTIDMVTPLGTITSLGNNIDATASCATGANDLPATDPLLLPLDSYGQQFLTYFVRTMPPRRSSPAIDLGAVNSCPGAFGTLVNIDQRSLPRPTNGDDNGSSNCDSGAVEFQPGDDPDDFALSVVFLGNGEGRVTSSPAGIDCTSNCSAIYLEDTMVTLTPAADPGNVFVGWSGACTGSAACLIDMDQAQSVTASFVVESFELAVTVNGNGSVNSNPGGISCPGDCSQSYASGTIVTLTPTALAGFQFNGWSGGGCSGTAACQVVMSQAQAVTASFGVAEYDLNVEVNGGGMVNSSPAGINCPGDCSEAYDFNQTVTLTATPDSGFIFDGWSGDCTGADSCVVTMSEARNVTADFSPAGFELTVTVGGSGTGTISSLPTGIDCPVNCSATFDSGQTVTLSATADAGQTFQNWSGACSGSGDCTVTMNSNLDVIAVFSGSDSLFSDRFED